MTETAQGPVAGTVDVPWRTRAFDQDLARVQRELKRLAKLDGEIAVGPWFSEVGFEVLYWIPFLRWAVAEFGLDPARMTAVSRGGTAAWYDGIATGYREVFGTMEMENFRRRNRERWREAHTQKQMEVAELDQAILEELGLDDLRRVLHPSLMYNLFRHFWRLREPASSIFAHSEYRPGRTPEHPVVHDLPDEFVAARFYFRPSFPDTPRERELIGAVLAGLVERWDVVLLNTGLQVDDHLEFDTGPSHRILQPLIGVPVEENLGAQSAVIARARAFVGTYGGLSYLAPAYGRDSVAFATAHERYVPTHLDVARAMTAVTGATLTILDERSLVLASMLSGEW